MLFFFQACLNYVHELQFTGFISLYMFWILFYIFISLAKIIRLFFLCGVWIFGLAYTFGTVVILDNRVELKSSTKLVVNSSILSHKQNHRKSYYLVQNTMLCKEKSFYTKIWSSLFLSYHNRMLWHSLKLLVLHEKEFWWVQCDFCGETSAALHSVNISGFVEGQLSEEPKQLR